jgi:signal transduction histidine kinase
MHLARGRQLGVRPVDVLVPVVLVVAAEIEHFSKTSTAFRGTADPVLIAILVALVPLPLLFWRRAPLGALVGVAVLLALPRLFVPTSIEYVGGLGALLAAVYACARWATKPWNRYGLVVPALVFALLSLIVPGFLAIGTFANAVPLVAAAWLGGAGLRRWEGRSELSAEDARADERARIARELHDVIAHHVSVMVVQAGSARLLMRTDTAGSEVALRNVERAGREALVEMRRMLGVLKVAADELPTTPPPTLEHLEQLTETMAAAGVTVELARTGTPRELPTAVDLTAYRIVQEALTNVLRHGGSATAEVHIDQSRDRLELRITNPVGHQHRPELPGGNGMNGMRERAKIFGGTLAAGPVDEEFRVQATLPLEGDRDA